MIADGHAYKCHFCFIYPSLLPEGDISSLYYSYTTHTYQALTSQLTVYPFSLCLWSKDLPRHEQQQQKLERGQPDLYIILPASWRAKHWIFSLYVHSSVFFCTSTMHHLHWLLCSSSLDPFALQGCVVISDHSVMSIFFFPVAQSWFRVRLAFKKGKQRRRRRRNYQWSGEREKREERELVREDRRRETDLSGWSSWQTDTRTETQKHKHQSSSVAALVVRRDAECLLSMRRRRRVTKRWIQSLFFSPQTGWQTEQLSTL